ncbi:MAG: hypothetical protein N2484_08340 [Clostridia bacterium]|nr:hypothetical protein [Clostridia bacterium]
MGMLEMYKYYARCNQAINSKMIKIMEELDFNVYNYKVDGYYKSIGEICNHWYIGDLSWLNSFRTIKEYSVFKDPTFENMPTFGEQPFQSITEFKENRTKLDRIILNLMDEIETEDLNKTGTRVNRLGEKKEHLFWKSLTHMFNHQTHHRGQISQILDQLKIENDYSNMILID